MPMKGLVVVANRLPVEIHADGHVGVSPGGLVSAVSSVTGEGAHWVGWGGDELRQIAAFSHGPLRLHPVLLSPDDLERYYRGFSNSVLWPLFHGRLRPVDLDRSWWHSYRSVNERFAATVTASAPLGGTIWIHDYHLLLTPAFIRAARPDLRIGLFVHIPFPDTRLFSMLPWRQEIIDGMLCADVLGFQLAEDAANFAAAATRVSGIKAPASPVTGRQHTVEVGAFPISIDFDHWDALGGRAGGQALRKRQELGVESILLGVDRLDYTKGIPQRLLAFGELLDEGRISSQSCTFVQVAVPTRSDVSAYQEEREAVEELVEAINARHRRTNGSVPVKYIDYPLNEAELAEWYRAADALVVTSFADGMNLVAKEFVAAHADMRATLILSEFAGASQDLKGALLVNPYDVEAIKQAMLAAIGMPAVDRQARLSRMRASVRNNDVHQWANRFLGQLDSTKRARPAKSATPSCVISRQRLPNGLPLQVTVLD